jgi:enoyl-CoA hydratase
MAAGNGRIGIPELLVGVPFPPSVIEAVRFALPPQHLQMLMYTGRTHLRPRAANSRTNSARLHPVGR